MMMHRRNGTAANSVQRAPWSQIFSKALSKDPDPSDRTGGDHEDSQYPIQYRDHLVLKSSKEVKHHATARIEGSVIGSN